MTTEKQLTQDEFELLLRTLQKWRGKTSGETRKHIQLALAAAMREGAEIYEDNK